VAANSSLPVQPAPPNGDSTHTNVDDDAATTEEHGEHGHPQQIVRTTVARTNRRRRPSGEPPPLPAELNTSGKWWLGLLAVVAVLWIVVPLTQRSEFTIGPEERALIGWIASTRTPWLTGAAIPVSAFTTSGAVAVLWWVSLIALVVWRRWRHLLVWIGAMLVVQTICGTVSNVIRRPRPFGVEILGPWQDFSMPSRPLALMAVVLVSALYALVPAGRLREAGKLIVGVVLAMTAAARVYLAQEWPSDAIAGIILGVTVPLVAFRLLTPNSVFPIVYRRGRTAHLELTDRRREAIEHGLRDQLGIIPVKIEPYGLDGSGGSTPLKITVRGEPDIICVFGKLYAKTHLRSDRWYKLGRTLMYGRLEDEKPFNGVRRLVQYEDYLLRLLREADVPVPEPYGIVEITPEQEYLLVTEFIDGGTEVGEAEVDDAVIDQGLDVVRKLWGGGLAHRDIKPANLLVRDGELVVIDTAFGELRPSPWRQAVDLANMMLVLALRTDAKRVYERATTVFSAEEIAEAFAATHGITVPSQLRRMLREDDRDLLAEFATLLPVRRRPIRTQRWSMRRIGLILATIAVAVAAVVAIVVVLKSPL